MTPAAEAEPTGAAYITDATGQRIYAQPGADLRPQGFLRRVRIGRAWPQPTAEQTFREAFVLHRFPPLQHDRASACVIAGVMVSTAVDWNGEGAVELDLEELSGRLYESPDALTAALARVVAAGYLVEVT